MRNGTYDRKCDRRIIQKFICRICGKRFSQQAYCCTYYLKKPKLLPQIAAGMLTCAAARQIARAIGCSHTTVIHQGNRIGRHALLFASYALEHLKAVRESMVLDHFETFQYCQEMPVGIATVVGRNSLFTYEIDAVAHKLGGEMTPGRIKRLESLQNRFGEIPPGSYRQSTVRVLKRLIQKVPTGKQLHLITDGKPEYRTAARPFIESDLLRMTSFPNPPRRVKHEPGSAVAVTRDREMFPVDLLHKLIRHSGANHKRETIAHGRRVNAIMLRLYVFKVWRNFVKDKSERSPQRKTPAMEVGLVTRFLDWRQVLSRRLFPWQQSLSSTEQILYAMKMETPAVGRNRHHDLVHAY